MLDQGSSSLCGPMALLYFVARSKPDAYVKYVIDLYECGEGAIANLKVKPGKSLMAANPPVDVNHADWIAAASLRDSKNILPYDSPKNETTGITLPIEIATWASEIGATNVLYDTSPMRMNNDTGMQNLFSAGVTSSNPKAWVILLIDSGVLYQPRQAPNIQSYHWVGLLSANVTKEKLSLEVFTWGTKRMIPKGGEFMKTSDFLQYYHGHIRCLGV